MFSQHLAAVFALSLFTTVSCTSNPKACTEIGCSDGFTATLNHSPWAAGSYQVDFDIDGQKFVCTTTLPFSDCNLPNPCNSDKVSIVLSGCALPQAQHSIAGFSTSLVDFTTLNVKISLNGSNILDRSFNPLFRTSQPNGPGCEPICRNASDSVSF